MRGAVVLAGGAAKRLGRPKAFVRLGGTSLVVRVLRAASEVAEEIVVVGRGPLAEDLAALVGPRAPVVADALRARSPLVGILPGASALRSSYVAVLACDLPFLSPRLLDRLFTEARGHDAAIPRWPDGRIEPLVAVYRRSALVAAAGASLHAGERANQEMVARLRDVRFVSTEDLRPLDSELRSLMNVNTPADLARARRLARTSRRRAARPRKR